MEEIKKIFYSLIIVSLLNTQAIAETKCFLVKENDKFLKQEGDCKTRHSPCSTFKIALSVIGYDSGILKDESHPELPYRKEYPNYIESWKNSQTPKTWIKNSCVWYSQVLTQQLGMKEFKRYIKQLQYGNEDISGDKGENNGLTHSWLSSSLKISPEEQLVFLHKLTEEKLPASKHAHEMTKNILYVTSLPGGWKLYGKTGSGSQWNKNKTQKTELQSGWFVGWIVKENRKIIFVHYIEDKKKMDSYAGPRAKEEAIKRLESFIRQDS